MQAVLRNGSAVPLAESLLVAAKRRLAHADHRGAIIESAAAAEVALTQALRVRLVATFGETAADVLLRDYQTLGGRLRLARMLAMNLPTGNLDEKLVRPRNAVAHVGSSATRAEATNVFELASALVSGVGAPAA